MMNQAEQASDSDSNTSSSWIFLDDSPSENQPSKKDDYTKYVDESIQELTSSLNPMNSEQETDSDGISIISEGDDIKEIPVSEDIPLIPEIEDVQGQAAVQEIVIDRKNEVYFNKYIVVSWIVLAVLTPVVLNYITSTYSKQDIQDDVVIKPESLMQGKRKYESKGETDEHRLDCASLQLNSVRKADKLDLAQLNTQILQKDDSAKALKKIKKNDESNRMKPNKNKKKVNERKKNKPEKNEGGKRQKKKKAKKGKDDNHQNHEKEIKSLKKKLKKKDKEIKDLSRLLKMKDKHLKMLEYKILKHLNELTKGKKSNDEILKDVSDIKSTLKVNSTSGEWYSKLYKGRSRIRNQEHESDWVFDRAAFRNKRRNIKNNWYWNWMTNREQLRLKRGFWHFTY